MYGVIIELADPFECLIMFVLILTTFCLPMLSVDLLLDEFHDVGSNDPVLRYRASCGSHANNNHGK